MNSPRAGGDTHVRDSTRWDAVKLYGLLNCKPREALRGSLLENLVGLSNQVLNPLGVHADNWIFRNKLQVECEMLDGAQGLPEFMDQVVHAGHRDGRVQK
jgi:hypothetical protein